jgi:hypothetical protein
MSLAMSKSALLDTYEKENQLFKDPIRELHFVGPSDAPAKQKSKQTMR